jgi:hypothetical protein
MTLTLGVDTYATVTEATVYATARGWSDFLALDAAGKEIMLIEAREYLDVSYAWKGVIASSTQSLSWPRQEVSDHEGRELAADLIPPALIKAQIELANMRTGGALVQSETTGKLQKVKADSVEVVFQSGGQTASETSKFKPIDRILTGLFIRRAVGRTRNRQLTKA